MQFSTYYFNESTGNEFLFEHNQLVFYAEWKENHIEWW